MVDRIKMITYWVVVIIMGFVIHYVNDIYWHNLVLYLLIYSYVFGLLVLSGVLFNNDLKKENLDDGNKLVAHQIREKIDAMIVMEQMDLNNYFKEQYIHNEIDNL